MVNVLEKPHFLDDVLPLFQRLLTRERHLLDRNRFVRIGIERLKKRYIFRVTCSHIFCFYVDALLTLATALSFSNRHSTRNGQKQ